MSMRIAVVVLATGFLFALCGAAERPGMPDREALVKAERAGNHKEAYEGFRRLAMDPDDDPAQVADDLESAAICMERANRDEEVDEFVEAVVRTHSKNWRLLWGAANSFRRVKGWGSFHEGKFYRGEDTRGAERHVTIVTRDRVRQLQLMQAAVELMPADTPKSEKADFYLAYASMVLGASSDRHGWKLQYLTELGELPDYDRANAEYYDLRRGAAAHADGMPVYYAAPRSWQEAKNDGERWRWCLKLAGEASESGLDRAKYSLAQFVRDQLDVHTLSREGFAKLLTYRTEESEKEENGPYAVSTLADDETIAWLRTGVKRFKLPEEYNFIRILEGLVGPKRVCGEDAANLLAQIFEDRQQYVKAAGWWKKSIELYGAGKDQWKQKRLDQIVGNWVKFDAMAPRPAGVEPVAELVFRNGRKVRFEARCIDMKKVLESAKAYIEAQPKPQRSETERTSIYAMMSQSICENQQQYIGQQVAQWEMDLAPREQHRDRRVTVKIPIKQAGAYVIDAKVEGGNTATIVLWLINTAIVKKEMVEDPAADLQKGLVDGVYCFVADAVTGKPLAKATVDLFGYRVHSSEGKVDTIRRGDVSDADGQVKFVTSEKDWGYDWIITAQTEDGHFGVYDFSCGRGFAYGSGYNEARVFVMTDRPVYRAGQTVKFKIWGIQERAEPEGRSPSAGEKFEVEIWAPEHKSKLMTKVFTADEYGGFEGQFDVPKDAKLGLYAILISNYGGGVFRVEEYKPSEFEVKVDVPVEPVTLGEKFAATITAKYYSGAPVASAKVVYKVLRTRQAQRYPADRWDKLYEPGYWWFGYDYGWYPGWARWGTERVFPWWIRRDWPVAPEIVSQNEVAIGSDGNVRVEIDTKIAKALYGESDHRYEIRAEVMDESRRIALGQARVLVGRQPYNVYAWLDRGYYSAGDVIEAGFKAQTLAQRPVKGNGELRLLKIAYEGEEPIETEVQKWALPTDNQGRAAMKITAVEPGQYRLSYVVRDDKEHAVEGGYVFMVRGAGFDGRQFRFNGIELVTDKRTYRVGDTVRLMVNTHRPDSTVVVFLRPMNGVCLPPKVLRIVGKSAIEEIAVVKEDMPNFYIEAFTVADGRVYDDMREVMVPPEERVLHVEVMPNAQRYRPGQKAKLRIKVSGADGRPAQGTAVVAMYDSTLEHAGDQQYASFRSYFSDERRANEPETYSNLLRGSRGLCRTGQAALEYLGVMGRMVADLEPGQHVIYVPAWLEGREFADCSEGGSFLLRRYIANLDAIGASPGGPVEKDSANTGRVNFIDSGLWLANVMPNADGIAELEMTMPKELATWRIMAWAMSSRASVGQGTAEVVTAAD